MSTKAKELTRDKFSTGLGVIAATLGSAVGLGNIWKFPYVTGENGGAAFILVYLACVFVVGLPVMLSELVLGRNSKSNTVTTFKKLAPGKPWFMVGIAGVVASLILMAFYSTVVGWVYAYVFKAISGALTTTNAEALGASFNGFTGATFEPILWQVAALTAVGIVITAGVSKGIEKVAKVLMPLLFILLLITAIRSLFLPGATQGLEFLFKPDFSKITSSVVLVALGLAFFKLSLGIGTMMTYGSYFGEKQNIPSTAIKVVFADILVSLLAGIAIFPAVFNYGLEPSAGPSLLFITIPTVFSSMPFGTVFMTMFFLLASFAATTAMLSIVEVPVAYFSEEFKWSRKKATLVVLTIILALGSISTLSFGLLSGYTVFGFIAFDLFDFLISNVFMPLIGLSVAIFVAWSWGWSKFYTEASNQGEINNLNYLKITNFILKYITPVLIIIILLTGLNLI